MICSREGFLEESCLGENQEQMSLLRGSGPAILAKRPFSTQEMKCPQRGLRVGWCVSKLLVFSSKRMRGALMDHSSPLSHDTDSALQRHLMMVLSHSDEGMVSMTADWRVTSVNAVASRLLSTSQHHLVGHFLWQRHPELVGTGLFQQCHQAQLSQKSTPLEALL